MNFAAVLRGEAAPEEGITLGQRAAGPGTVAGCVCLPGHRLPRSLALRVALGPGTAGVVGLSVCQ